MSVRSGQSITVLFTTRVFATGVGANATGTPTGTLYVNGVSNAATVTVANLSTGLYTAQVTLPTLNIGDEVELIIAATVSGVSDTAVIWGDTKDFAIDSSGDVTFNNTSIATVTTVTSVSGSVGSVASAVQVGSYSAGQDPGTLVGAIAIETGISLKQSLEAIGAAVAGKLSGATGGAGTITIYAMGSTSTARISATVDANGNRTAVTLTL